MTSITLIENEAPPIPIKTDKTGRLRLSHEHKEALLDVFESSSMSGVRPTKIGLKNWLFVGGSANWVEKSATEAEEAVA